VVEDQINGLTTDHFALPCQVSPHSSPHRPTVSRRGCPIVPTPLARQRSMAFPPTNQYAASSSPTVSLCICTGFLCNQDLAACGLSRQVGSSCAVVILQDSKTRWIWPLADLDRDHVSAIVVVFVMFESIIVVRTVLVEWSVSR
jgi:hypothetical protein